MKILGYKVTGWIFRDGVGNLLCMEKTFRTWTEVKDGIETEYRDVSKVKLPIPDGLTKEKDIVKYATKCLKEWEQVSKSSKQRKALERLARSEW